MLSNQLDELVLWQILTQIEQEATYYNVEPDSIIKRLVYGVGTNLITSRGQSSLDGVYKLVAIKSDSGWVPAIKISESPAKILNPGQKRVWRIYDQLNKSTSDLISLNDEDPREMDPIILHHPVENQTFRQIDRKKISLIEPLLTDVFVDGNIVHDSPSIKEIRITRDNDLERLDPGIKRIMNPHIYHISLTPRLWNLKQEIIETIT